VAHVHAHSWPGACTVVAAAADHGGTVRGSSDKAVWSTVYNAWGGDAAAVPANGAEGDRGSQ
jgi:hypothetical protein